MNGSRRSASRRSGRRARAALLAALGIAGCTTAPGSAVEITDLGARIAVRCDGQPFCEYRRDNARRPVFWPIYAPGGAAVTRAFPFAEVAGEPRDHPHQESLWFGHGDVNGIDFWGGDGHVVEQELSIDSKDGELRGVSAWLTRDGQEVCRDFHRYAFAQRGEWRFLDVDITLVASDGELRLGDTREGTFALRLRPELALRGAAAGGTIVNSEGQTGLDVWGKRARWVAYAGLLEGDLVVVAVFDHPQNHGHPTWWHARDYGLLAGNPFGMHDLAGGPVGAGALTIPAGGQLRCRYRVCVGRGRERLREIDGIYQQWAAH